MSGDGQLASARHHQRFDGHQLATIRCPRESGHRADLGLLLGGFGGEARRADHFFNPRLIYNPRALLAIGLLARPPTHQRGDVPLESAEARLTRVAIRNQAERFIRELEVVIADPVLIEEARQEIPPRDLDLLLDRVPSDANYLEAIAQRVRNIEDVVRRADEQHRRQIKGLIEIVIGEGRVLRGVEHFEHRGGGIAARSTGGHLVDFIDHQHRVVHLHATQRLQEQPRERSHVGAAMPTNLRFVAHATHRNTVERAPDARGDGFAE